MGITVVLTAYKRIDSLREQLEAIRNQSIVADEIWLYQDKIDKDYSVKIDEVLLDEFDKVRVEKKNIGVWGRFGFAREVQTDMVCLFDDDTIPGTRWLENCVSQMQIKEGIYGTVGIVLDKDHDYPWRKYYRIGWCCNNGQTVEVDFVGHSWFLKTKWLSYMFDDPDIRQKYKYAAEDMSLSFQCQKHGIKTFVPPHPIKDDSLWGSIPVKARSLGEDSVALSLSSNKMAMREAVDTMILSGWELMYQRDYNKVLELRRSVRKMRLKQRMRKICDGAGSYVKKGEQRYGKIR